MKKTDKKGYDIFTYLNFRDLWNCPIIWMIFIKYYNSMVSESRDEFDFHDFFDQYVCNIFWDINNILEEFDIRHSTEYKKIFDYNYEYDEKSLDEKEIIKYLERLRKIFYNMNNLLIENINYFPPKIEIFDKNKQDRMLKSIQNIIDNAKNDLDSKLELFHVYLNQYNWK